MFQPPHIRLLATDLPASFRFYRDILGLSVGFGSENDVYAEFKIGDQMIALFKREIMAETVGTADKSATAEAQDKAALVLATEDVDAAAEMLRAKGIGLVTEPQNRSAWGIRTAHFRDPDGNLSRSIAQSQPEATRAVCAVSR